jgi:H-NS histone family protein
VVRKWEYKKIALNEAPRRGDEIDLLCDAGEDRWELVAVLPNGVAYLKREVMDPTVGERRKEEMPRAEPAEAGSAAANGGAASVKTKYRDPVTGETWSGRGRMASWLKRKQDAGEDIETYRV